VVVIGSGAAGIAVALTAAARGLAVLMITKDLVGGASPLAQGGLAAAIGAGDTPEAHASDTKIAGVGLCDGDPVAELAAGSPAAIDWLVSKGARLERRDLRLEGGHSHRRIVHSGDDASGAEVHRALLAALLTARDAGRIEVLDRTVALDLTFGGAGGARVAGLVAGLVGAGGTLEPGVISAGAVVIAAGGLGQAFATTSNPSGATGDGIAIAARAGAVLRDVEFVQFHPTVLWRADGAGQQSLVTEALRGAGAVLRDLDGKPFMAGRHPLGDLAPRDIVAAAGQECIERDGGGHVWLDATALGRHLVEDGFPTVTAACRQQGVDPVTGLIPVAPGAHYSCGGIAAGMDGRTSVPGLYAVGEAASTGVHGANRLASNSLVEAVIMGRNAVQSIMVDELGSGGGPVRGPEALGLGAEGRGAGLPGAGGSWGWPYGVGPGGRGVLTAAMSRYAGVVRDADGLRELLRVAAGLPFAERPVAEGPVAELPAGGLGGGGVAGGTAVRGLAGGGGEIVLGRGVDLDLVEGTNLHVVSVLIAAAAVGRTESRGCHRRRDYPQTWPEARHTILRWTPDGLKVGL
jgi:L-aspartate oxidase